MGTRVFVGETEKYRNGVCVCECVRKTDRESVCVIACRGSIRLESERRCVFTGPIKF